jgi:ankyrin repeat protein
MLLTARVAIGQTDPQLVAAVKAQDVEAVRSLLRHGKASLDRAGVDGTTALHWAVLRNNRVMTDALISAGADINSANDYGVTALYLSCSVDAAIARALLNARGNPNAALTNGETVLMRCAYNGNTDAVRALIEHGANVNARGGLHEQTALMWAAAQRHPEVVQLLIQGGADIRARTPTRREVVGTGTTGTDSPGGGPTGKSGMEWTAGGFTPILFAAQQGDIESARLLLAAGAEINDSSADGASVLVTASQSGHTALATFLLANGADPNRADAGYTPLHMAVLRGDLALAKRLLVQGADVNARVTKGTAVARYSDRWFLPAELIGATPFLLAAQYAELDIMRLLAASGADITAPAANGTTPLMAAAGVQWHERFDRRGRNLSIEAVTAEREQEGRTIELLKLALAAGADINAANKAGQTALHAAATRKLRSVYDFLVSQGARIDAKNKAGKTPPDLLMEFTVF